MLEVWLSLDTCKKTTPRTQTHMHKTSPKSNNKQAAIWATGTTCHCYYAITMMKRANMGHHRRRRRRRLPTGRSNLVLFFFGYIDCSEFGNKVSWSANQWRNLHDLQGTEMDTKDCAAKETSECCYCALAHHRVVACCCPQLVHMLLSPLFSRLPLLILVSRWSAMKTSIERQ